MCDGASQTCDYAAVRTLDPKWQAVRPGQNAVARLSEDDEIATVLAVHESRAEAVAFARGLQLQCIAVLHRDGEQSVCLVPWSRHGLKGLRRLRW
jgi:hypothetical protein